MNGPDSMRAMVLTRAAAGVLESVERHVPTPPRGHVLIRVRACGVCRTDLHVVDGELPSIEIPIVPGHLIAQVAVHDGRDVYAFTSPGDEAAQRFARDLGCVWAGPSTAPPPAPLDAAIIFAPVGRLVPEALSRVVAGGVVVCAGIHMSD